MDIIGHSSTTNTAGDYFRWKSADAGIQIGAEAAARAYYCAVRVETVRISSGLPGGYYLYLVVRSTLRAGALVCWAVVYLSVIEGKFFCTCTEPTHALCLPHQLSLASPFRMRSLRM